MGTDDLPSPSPSRNENYVETETESQKRKLSDHHHQSEDEDEDEDEEDDEEDTEEEPAGQGVTHSKLWDPSRWGCSCRCPETKLQKFLGLFVLILYMIWSSNGWNSVGILPVSNWAEQSEGATSKSKPRKQQDVFTKGQRGLRDVQTFLAYPLLVLNTWAGVNILLGVFTRTVVFCSMHLVAGVFLVIVLIPYATCGALRTENYLIFFILFLLVILYSFFGATSWALIQEIMGNNTRKVGAGDGSSSTRP